MQLSVSGLIWIELSFLVSDAHDTLLSGGAGMCDTHAINFAISGLQC